MASAQAVSLVPTCPYVGLQPYTSADREFFFGRQRDTEIIFSNLLSARLTVLYGASGVGKSSIVQAGLLPLVQGQRRTAAIYFREWQSATAFQELKSECIRCVQALSKRPLSADPALQLDELLYKLAQEAHCAIYLVLDQFEEFFLYHDERNTTFDAEFASAVNRDDIDANFLIAIRDDSISRLDRFRARIANLLGNLLRIRHLDTASATEAVREPLRVYNEKHPSDPPIVIEDALVTRILSDLRPKQPGRDIADKTDTAGDGLIETPFLQLVLERLWREEVGHGSRSLRLETFETIGNADQIVKTHFDSVMSTLSPEEQKLSADVFRFLVTPDRSKVAVSGDALAELAGVDKVAVVAVMEKLCRGANRVLRAVAAPDLPGDLSRYEIFHDVLAAAILDWRARYVQQQQRAESERAAAEAAAHQIEQEKRKAAEAAERERAAARERELEQANQLAEEQRKRADAQAQAAEAQRQRADEQARAASLQRRLLIVLMVMCLIAAGLAVFAQLQKRRAVLAMRQANEARLLVTTAVIDSDRLDLSLLLSLEASRVSDSPELRGILLQSLSSNRYLTTFLRPGHAGVVRNVAFSPDGKTLASAGVDGTILLWDVAQAWRLGAPLVGHKGTVYSVAFSPDGKTLASAGEDRRVFLWDVNTGSPLPDSPLTGYSDEVYSVAFSPNGNFLATASKDGSIAVWDHPHNQAAPGPRWLRKGHDGSAYSVAFSPDGRMLASGGADNKVALWDVVTGKSIPRSPLTGHTDEVFTVAFSPDGKMLASGGMDSSIIVWNLSTFAQQFPTPLKGHSNSVFSVSFNSDSSLLASAGTDGKVMLWDAHTGKPRVRELTGHTDKTYSVAFSPEKDGTRFASGSADGTITLWDYPARKWLGNPLSHRYWVNRVAFSPNGKLLASGGAGLVLWDVNAGNAIGPALLPPSVGTGDIAFSPDGELFACNSNGNITVWDVQQRKPIPDPLGAENGNVSSLVFKPDPNAKILVMGKKDGSIIFWDLDHKQPIGEPLKRHTKDVTTMAFSRDGKLLASGSLDNSIFVWDVATHVVRHGPFSKDEWGRGVSSLAFGLDSRILASSAAANNEIVLWNITSGKGTVLTKHRGTVNTLQFSPDGKMLASGGDDKTVVLWDVATGQAIGPPLKEQNAAIQSLAFSPDGKSLASGSYLTDARDNWPLVLWDISFQSWKSRACEIATRNLTADEWNKYLADEPPEVTCPMALLRDADAKALSSNKVAGDREFTQVVQIAVHSDDAELNNRVCWYGSLDGLASTVEPACEHAVKVAKDDSRWYRDSRGLARACMGPANYALAIDDFESFVKFLEERLATDSRSDFEGMKRKREAWIVELKAGRNPFDPATLRALRRE